MNLWKCKKSSALPMYMHSRKTVMTRRSFLFATVLFIALEYIVPAIVIGVIIFMQPIVLIYMSHSIEKKM